jgi:DNA-binding GntR family transcriptional regulator
MSIRPVSKQPGRALYRQVVEDVIARLGRSELTPGERLAPEAKLAEQYGVNRLTMRRALEELVRAGVVRTEHGVGSFIAVPAVRHRIDDGEASLSESMARRGIEVCHRILSIAERDGEVEYRFVRDLDGEPWSIGEVLVPEALAPRDWDGSGSVFAAMAEAHGLTIQRAETAFSAGPADPEEAGRLEVPVGSALLTVRGFNTDETGRVVARFSHRIRADRAEYVVRLPQ